MATRQGGPPAPVYVTNASLLVALQDGTLVFDRITGGLEVIDIQHHEVHAGDMYTVSDYDASVDTAAPKLWRLTTGATEIIHINLQIDLSAAGLVELYEHPTLTGAGTGLTAYNNNRLSAQTASLAVAYDPSASALGTRLFVRTVGSNAPAARIGGSARPAIEWVLRPNEDYVVRVTPATNGTAVSLVAEFYEEVS